jgi:cell division protein FtsL
MATLAAIFRRVETAAPAQTPVQEFWSEQAEVNSWQLRPLPCEDVYFWSKKIDNARLVREADPAAGRRAWKAGLQAACIVAALVALVMPKALGMVAGYRIHMLAQERERLRSERTVLQLEEARLLSPERLEQLARQYGLVNPDVKHVVFLNAKPADGALAMNITQ